VNDDADVMKALVHRLLRMRVRPYYLYQMDLITGGAHFKVDVRKGIEIIRALRGHTTGYAVPQYVIDAPGGGGKVPINPDYVEKSPTTRSSSAITRALIEANRESPILLEINY
jgi:lysine 2,3-aminomutase